MNKFTLIVLMAFCTLLFSSAAFAGEEKAAEKGEETHQVSEVTEKYPAEVQERMNETEKEDGQKSELKEEEPDAEKAKEQAAEVNQETQITEVEHKEIQEDGSVQESKESVDKE